MTVKIPPLPKSERFKLTKDSYTILDGTHFIYRNNAEEISRIVKEFLDETKSGT